MSCTASGWASSRKAGRARVQLAPRPQQHRAVGALLDQRVAERVERAGADQLQEDPLAHEIRRPARAAAATTVQERGHDGSPNSRPTPRPPVRPGALLVELVQPRGEQPGQRGGDVDVLVERGAGGTLAGRERAHELLHEQRVAVGVAERRAGEPLLEPRAQETLEECAGLASSGNGASARTAARSERCPRRAPPGARPRHRDRAHRQQQRERRRRGGLHQLLGELQRERVGPVQVVEHHQQPAGGRLGLQVGRARPGRALVQDRRGPAPPPGRRGRRAARRRGRSPVRGAVRVGRLPAPARTAAATRCHSAAAGGVACRSHQRRSSSAKVAYGTAPSKDRLRPSSHASSPASTSARLATTDRTSASPRSQPDQPGLADPGLADQGGQAPLTLQQAVQDPPQRELLLRPADSGAVVARAGPQ